jgi:hypothetical protein
MPNTIGYVTIGDEVIVCKFYTVSDLFSAHTSSVISAKRDLCKYHSVGFSDYPIQGIYFNS